MFLRFVFVVLLSFGALSACSMGASTTPWSEPTVSARPQPKVIYAEKPGIQARQLPQQVPAPITQKRIALLLPLSGPHAGLGQQLMQAAQLAVQDLAPDNLVVAPFDTASGAARALQSALAQHTDVIVGPLFSADVAAVKSMAATQRVPVLALSNDTTQADTNTYLMGSGPVEQVQRVVDFAASKGRTRLVALLPESAFGNTIQAALPNLIQPPATLVDVIKYNPDSPNISTITTALLQDTNAYDAVLLPDSPARAALIAAALRQAGALENTTGAVPLLGSTLWDDASDAAALMGGWFPAPDPAARQQFSERYLRMFGQQPAAVVSLAYDAMALAAVLAARNWPYTADALTQPQGFAGMGGVFRLMRDGTVQRSLAIQELSPSGRRIIDAAQGRF